MCSPWERIINLPRLRRKPLRGVRKNGHNVVIRYCRRLHVDEDDGRIVEIKKPEQCI